jgi:hypothetical protein
MLLVTPDKASARRVRRLSTSSTARELQRAPMFVATRLRRAVRAAHDSGNLYVGLGAAGLVASGGLAYREWREDQRLEAMREIRAQIRDLKKDQDEKLRAKREGARFSDRKVLFTATINRRVHAAIGFDGPLALTQVTAGQPVAVLEVDIGPEGGYHECRNEFGEGLYPKAYITPDDATAYDATAAGDGASSKHIC